MFTVASRFRRLKFVGSYLSTIEAVGTGSWLSVVQVLLDVSIALLVAIIEFHGGFDFLIWWDTSGIPHNFIRIFFCKKIHAEPPAGSSTPEKI